MSDYTPTTEEVRNQWACEPDEYAEFDRWLASVKAEAWDEGYAVDRRFNAPTPNPYREAVTE